MYEYFLTKEHRESRDGISLGENNHIIYSSSVYTTHKIISFARYK